MILSRCKAWLSAKRLHTILTGVWAVQIPFAATLWRDSIAYVVACSVYANFIGHVSALQAVKAEEAATTNVSE